MTHIPADQPPLFDVVMGDAVPTFHRGAPVHAAAHAAAMAEDARRAALAAAPHVFTERDVDTYSHARGITREAAVAAFRAAGMVRA